MSPTLYHLIFKANNHEEYDVYEQHSGQGKGDLWTGERYIGETCIPGKEADFVAKFNEEIIGGKVCSYEIEDYIEVEK